MEALRFGILQTQSDGRLAALAARGHERPFEVLVGRHRAPLLRYCRRLLTDGQAEDAVQQAFLQAWTALRSGAEVDAVRPWLYAIARNQAVSALRARRPVEALDESLPHAGAEAAVEHRATLRAALSGLAGMRAHQREALVRTALSGESHDAIGRDLGMSGGAVRQLVHRARLDLRAAATALVPMPVAHWLAAAQTRTAPLPERVGELTAGAGGAGLVAGVAKGGAVLAVAGAVAGAAPVVVHHRPAPRHEIARVAIAPEKQ